jgi:hypothetical protein
VAASLSNYYDKTASDARYSQLGHTHPLSDLQQSGATSGQIPQWNGSAWVPVTPAPGGVTSFNTRTGAVTLTSGDVTTALGYTPYDASNPSAYISGNQTITLSGDITGSGATAITATLANSGVSAGTYTNATVTVDAKGRVTAASSGSNGVAYAARAWVNFNGTGTVAIRASGNVSSITDNGTGDYTVNFTTAMPDANYAMAGVCGETTGTEVWEVNTRAASSLRINVYATESGGNKDSTMVCVAIFR